jgi:hypothetical protein
MRFETLGRTKKVVLWAYASVAPDGEQRVSAPAELMVRWQQNVNEQIGPEGTPILTNATVFVSQDIAEGSIMRLGKLKDLPTPLDNLLEVVSFSKTDSLNGKSCIRSVTLQAHHDTLPQIV